MNTETATWGSKIVADILARCENTDPPLLNTELYNETWLLRIVLDWYRCHPESPGPFKFEQNAAWFSEGRLRSPFSRGKSREGYTHADGLIGHFSFTDENKSEIKVNRDATQLTLIEAKLGSPLSSGTKNAPNYNQAARNACCLAYIASKAGIEVNNLSTFSFYVVVPKLNICNANFISWVDPNNIKEAIQNRANQCGMGNWYDDKLKQYCDAMKVELITWEQVLTDMESSRAGKEYREFYDKCVEHDSRLK